MTDIITAASSRPTAGVRANKNIGNIGPNRRTFNDWARIANALPVLYEENVVQTALDIFAQADRDAPVGSGKKPKPGTLRASGHVKTNSRGGNVVRATITFAAAEKEPSDSRHYYAFFVEVGTHSTPAQPFLVPAVIANRPKFMARFTQMEAQLRAMGIGE